MVGAGAAGITAAIRAAETGARVTLVNAHPKIGLKILMSGGTRCNVTHREVTGRDFHGGSRAFVERVLRAFTPEGTLEWFRAMGVELKLEPTGKYFPVTDDAHTVLDALLREVERTGVTLVPGARVVRLERGEGDAWRLGTQRVGSSAAFGAEVGARGVERWPLPAVEPDEWSGADAVVLACGGLSFPRTGSDGTGYALATSLGHTLVAPVPALTPLVADDPLCAEAQGVGLESELTLWVGGRARVRAPGPLLVTHFGYSGPAALDLSRHWLRAEGGADRRVTASFAAGKSYGAMKAAWKEAVAASPRAAVRRWLSAYMPARVAGLLAREAGVRPLDAIAQVPRERRDALLRRVTERELPVTGTLGYEKAEATAGGVALDEVNPSTLESRAAPGVFLCGEMLDVEGRLGGFNFQWAWSSGTVAGMAVTR